MKKQFNENDFTCWTQDTQDMSYVNSKEAYIALRSNLCIEYCIKVLGMMPQDAWTTANNLHISDSKRLMD